jgi:IS5 family transposase
MDVFEVVPRLSRAMDPELSQLDRLLDDVLFQMVRADLLRRHPHPATRGRPSPPVEVILRMLVVKRLYRWSYEETEHFVGDSRVLRQFRRVDRESVPDATPLIRRAQLSGPQTREQVSERAGA